MRATSLKCVIEDSLLQLKITYELSVSSLDYMIYDLQYPVKIKREIKITFRLYDARFTVSTESKYMKNV